MEREELLRVLNSAKIDVINGDKLGTTNDDGLFIRRVGFGFNGSTYSILWFKNLMTLTTGSGLDVIFDDIEYSGTWPNRFLRNLQFLAGGNVVAVLGIEEYGC